MYRFFVGHDLRVVPLRTAQRPFPIETTLSKFLCLIKRVAPAASGEAEF
jgi:hypothetical protein